MITNGRMIPITDVMIPDFAKLEYGTPFLFDNNANVMPIPLKMKGRQQQVEKREITPKTSESVAKVIALFCLRNSDEKSVFI